MGKLSVVLATINDSIATNLTVAEIIRQLEFDRIDYEIIIVDNGSYPEEKDNIQAFLRYNNDFPVRYLEHDIKGTIPPHSFGVEAATGKYVIMLDPHMVFSDHYFKTMLASIKRIGCEVLFSPFTVGSMIHSDGDIICGSPLIEPNPFGKTNYIGETCKFGDKPFPVLSDTLAGVITTKEWLMKIGNMFPAAFKIAGGHTAESLLIGIPTWMFGGKCYVEPSALVFHPVYRQRHGDGRNTNMALSMATAAYILGGDKYLKDMPSIYGIFTEDFYRIPKVAKEAREYIDKNAVYTLDYLRENWESMKRMYKVRDSCMCGGKIELVLDLGQQPLAGYYPEKPEEVNKYPLRLGQCNSCSLVQLMDVVDKGELFTSYYSAYSMTEHFEDLADKLAKEYKGFLVDIGSNDGVLLKPAKKLGFKVLGVDPSIEAEDTIKEYFSEAVARSIVKVHGQADVITASNVFAHIEDTDEVLRGVDVLLKPDGHFIVEVGYLVDVVNKMQFDTIYHEHLYYYTFKTLGAVLARKGFKIIKIEHIPIHGGSIRVTVSRQGEAISRDEESIDLIDFKNKVEKNKEQMLQKLQELKGKRIVGYGAAGRANTYLNYCGVDSIEYIVDESPARNNHYTPGTNIPIYPVERFRQDNPDYCWILAWNCAKMIMDKEDYKGKYIIHLPEYYESP